MNESSRVVTCDWCEQPIYRRDEVSVITVQGRDYLVHCTCGQLVVESHVSRGGELMVMDREGLLVNR